MSVIVSGKCPKCGAKLGVPVDGNMVFGAIVTIDERWHKITCPSCGAKLECRPKPREGDK